MSSAIAHPIDALPITAVMACRVAFRVWFGLPRGAADVLGGLYLAGGRYVGVDPLARAVGLTPCALRYHLTLIRQALDCEGLDSEQGHGYRLSEIGMAECRNAMLTIGEELRRAG